MLKPEQAANKSMGGASNAPLAACICPRCGNVHAAARAPERASPGRYAVHCPGCGEFEWDMAAHKVVEAPNPEEKG